MTIAELQKMTKGMPVDSEVYFGVHDSTELFYVLSRTAIEFPDAEPDTQNFIIYLQAPE